MRTAATYLPLGKFCGQCTSDGAESEPSSERRDRCESGAALRCNRTPSGEDGRLIFFACLVSYRPLGRQSAAPLLNCSLQASHRGLHPFGHSASVSRPGPGKASSPALPARRKGCAIKTPFCVREHRLLLSPPFQTQSAAKERAHPSPVLTPSSLPTVGRRVPAGTIAQPSWRAKQDEREDPRRQADGRREEKARRATTEPDELPLLEVRPAQARPRLPLPT